MTHPHEALTNAPAFDPALGVFVPAGTPAEAFGGPVAEDAGLRPGVKFETRLEAAERESKARSAQIAADMEAASAAGTLWTVHAGMYPGKVVAFLCWGRVDDSSFIGDHNFAPAVFGPLHLIGKTHREAMFETFKLFTVDKIEITTIR